MSGGGMGVCEGLVGARDTFPNLPHNETGTLQGEGPISLKPDVYFLFSFQHRLGLLSTLILYYFFTITCYWLVVLVGSGAALPNTQPIICYS